ncbi:MAG: esterase [Hyphomicrobiales bacterium]|nr:esterase [Hyphomicrobiales bacterium]
MNAFSKIDMQEATRLTREGRLEEAMAVLRGEAPRNDRAVEQADSAQLILDMIAPTGAGGAWTSPTSKPAGFARSPAAMEKVLDGLKHFKPAAGFHGGHAPRATPSVPKGARYEERAYSNQAGSRGYKLYLPSGYSGQPLPLVVMLHGCTQSPDDFALGTRMNEVAEEQTFIVAYPAQAQSANMSRCWNWFSVGDQQRDRGEPSLIAGITREIMGEFEIETGRVYVAGLSAGGAAAAIMGSTHPDLYAAVGVHSGLACGAAKDMPSAMAAMRQGSRGEGGSSGGVPTIVFHGDRDSTVHPVNGDQVIAQCSAGAGFGTSISHGEAAGMPFTRTVHVDDEGRAMHEQWLLHGAGHAWSGGSASGSYTDPRGPDASREMIRFFLGHRALR